jgi:hypothetical protein
MTHRIALFMVAASLCAGCGSSESSPTRAVSKDTARRSAAATMADTRCEQLAPARQSAQRSQEPAGCVSILAALAGRDTRPLTAATWSGKRRGTVGGTVAGSATAGSRTHTRQCGVDIRSSSNSLERIGSDTACTGRIQLHPKSGLQVDATTLVRGSTIRSTGRGQHELTLTGIDIPAGYSVALDRAEIRDSSGTQPIPVIGTSSAGTTSPVQIRVTTLNERDRTVNAPQGSLLGLRLYIVPEQTTTAS